MSSFNAASYETMSSFASTASMDDEGKDDRAYEPDEVKGESAEGVVGESAESVVGVRAVEIVVDGSERREVGGAVVEAELPPLATAMAAELPPEEAANVVVCETINLPAGGPCELQRAVRAVFSSRRGARRRRGLSLRGSSPATPQQRK